jgi:hypothetical protein
VVTNNRKVKSVCVVQADVSEPQGVRFGIQHEVAALAASSYAPPKGSGCLYRQLWRLSGINASFAKQVHILVHTQQMVPHTVALFGLDIGPFGALHEYHQSKTVSRSSTGTFTTGMIWYST